MADAEKILSQHEVDALLSAIDSGAAEPAPIPSSQPYDFKRPTRVPRDQIRALQTLHEGFARNLQSALAGMLRTAVEVKVTGLHQLPLEEFLASLPRPTALAVLSCEPFEGTFLFGINPTIAFPMIERLLGSAWVGSWQQDKALSPLEWTVLDTVIGRAADLLKEAWSAVGPVYFRIVRRESDATRIHFQNPNEAAVSVVMEVAVGDQRGTVELAFPVVGVEGHLERLSPVSAIAGKRKDSGGSQEDLISRRLALAELNLGAGLGAEVIKLKELQSLRPGDLLVTHHPVSQPVTLSIEGRAKFNVRLGSFKDRKAAKVVSIVGEGEGPPATFPALEVRKGAASPPAETAEPSAPGFVENLFRLSIQASAVLAEKPMRLKDVLALCPGEIVVFPRRAEEPLEFRAANRALAQGAAVKVGERFGLRLTSILDPRERVRALGP